MNIIKWLRQLKYLKVNLFNMDWGKCLIVTFQGANVIIVSLKVLEENRNFIFRYILNFFL